MKLLYSFPPLTKELLQEQMSILKDMFGFAELPLDYQEFLLQNNGGFVSPGLIDSGDTATDYKQICFDTTLLKTLDSTQTIKASLYSFSAVWLNDKMDKDAVEQWDLFELMASNRYLRSYFDIMPNQMIAIGSCNGRNPLDMICLSLAEKDFGAVYYYFNNANGPEHFEGSYQQSQLQKVYDTYGIEHNSFLSSSSQKDAVVHDAILKTYFVKIADSFKDFISSPNILHVVD